MRYLAILLAIGCQGVIGDPEGELPSGPEGIPNEDPAEVSPLDRSLPAASAPPLRRLSRSEYRATVAAAFPELDLPELDLPGDEPVDNQRPRPERGIDDTDLGQYLGAAETLAPLVAPLLDCEGEGCLASVLRERAAILYRAPVPDALLTELLALHDALRADDASAGEAREALALRLLLSPRLLHHVELGHTEGDTRRLDAHAVAARLSYLLTGSPPDAALRAAASAEELDGDDLRAHAERLLGDADETLWDYHLRWLRLERLETVALDDEDFPEDSPELRRQMRDDARALVEDAIARGAGGYAHLLTEDGGVLALPAFLLANSSSDPSRSPIFRGLAFTEHFLCVEPPPLPEDAAIIETEVEDRLTDGQCAHCHGVFEPYGRLFETYDALGRHDGEGLGHGGVVENTYDLDGSYADLDDLAEALVHSTQARECYAKRFFEYVVGRHAHEPDAGSLETIRAFEDGDVRALVLRVVTSDAFTTRHAPAGTCEEDTP